MTPEERQLLTALANRIKAAPTQQKDQEADDMLRQLVQQRPDTTYLLAQTVIMQDFALRNAQAQITDLQRQLSEAANKPAQGGSFLGGLFGSSPPPPAAPASQQYRAPGPASVPPTSPYTRSAPRPSYTGPAYNPPPGAPVLQAGQGSSFLQQAATTAVGIAGGALLFEGIQSLFWPHYGGFIAGGPMVGPWGGGAVMGPWGGAGWMPPESLSETTIVNNNYYDGAPPDAGYQADPGYQPDPGSGYQDVDPGYQDSGYDAGSDISDAGGDFGGGNDDSFI